MAKSRKSVLQTIARDEIRRDGRGRRTPRVRPKAKSRFRRARPQKKARGRKRGAKAVLFPSLVLPPRLKKERIGNLLATTLHKIGAHEKTGSFPDMTARFGAVLSLDATEPAGTQLALPVVLKLATETPSPNESWKEYKSRVEDKLEQVNRLVKQTLGFEATRLIAANALKVKASPDQIAALTANPKIQKIELDPLLRVTLLDDVVRELGKQQFIVRNPGIDGRGVKVAVLDSGIDLHHPFLKIASSVSTSGESVQIPGAHGTHCAGSIASSDTYFPGIAPGATLLNVKVLQANGSGTHTNIVKGIDEALDLGADVLSMSLGFNHLPTSSWGGHGWMCKRGDCPLCVAVDNAVKLDSTIVVVAAGNEHLKAESLRRTGQGSSFDTELGCPGQARESLTVGAITKGIFLPADFSSRGPTSFGTKKPDLVAQGVNITSTVPVMRDATGKPVANPSRQDLFGRMSGTSMATPIVAGVAALIIQLLRDKGLKVTPASVKNELFGNGLAALTGSVNTVGNGRIDLSRL